MRFIPEAEARAALDQLPGIRWRPFGRSDLPAIADFYAACEDHDGNSERTSLADLREFWDSPRSVPSDDTLAGWDGEDAVVATAWSGCNRAVTAKRGVHLGGAVRPDRRREGIGTRVLQWELAHGNWDPSRSGEVRRVMNEAFTDHWGHVDLTPQLWDERVDSHAFRPDWTVLATDAASGEVVGAAMNTAWEQDWRAQGYTGGYTDRLGVLPSHRGRGIGSLLLIESMRRFARAGMDAAGLDVDTANPSGAVGLYENLGYQRTSSNCIHQFTRSRPDGSRSSCDGAEH